MCVAVEATNGRAQQLTVEATNSQIYVNSRIYATIEVTSAEFIKQQNNVNSRIYQ